MKQVIIIRGLPGSGKDRKVHQILSGVMPDTAVVCSADDFFMVGGEYKFDPTKLGEAHATCMAKFCQALVDGKQLIICNNSNSMRWEFRHYGLAAGAAGYNVEIEFATEQPHESKFITIDHVRRFAARNVHGVPLAAVAAMAARWED
jgi:hypothetical protein